MKGVVLAGGTGSRLYPLTHAVSKQLLPVYDKPMIYYPLSVLMLAGIREIQLICTSHDVALFKQLLGDGGHIGLQLSYAIQQKPAGIAQAFTIAEQFLDGDSVCLVLGDNVYHGGGFSGLLKKAIAEHAGATIFAYRVHDPERYGVVELDDSGKPVSIEEKPEKPKSHYAVSGLYFYDNAVVGYAKQLKPSARGELEITDINQRYMDAGKLSVKLFDRGFAWLDTGTHKSLHEASAYVEVVEKRTGLKVACLEEIAWRQGFIDDAQLIQLARKLIHTDYGKYLSDLLENPY